MDKKPVAGKIYTAKEMKAIGCTPCTHCTTPTHLCNSQCVWAYWNNGSRETTEYYWDGRVANGEPLFTDNTWHRVE